VAANKVAVIQQKKQLSEPPTNLKEEKQQLLLWTSVGQSRKFIV